MTALAAAVVPNSWQRLRCGEGSQGPRTEDWAAESLRPALREGWDHTALFRRHLTRKGEIATFLVYAPADTPLEELARAAGTRWTIKAVFKLAKGRVHLDQYEVRS